MVATAGAQESMASKQLISKNLYFASVSTMFVLVLTLETDVCKLQTKIFIDC